MYAPVCLNLPSMLGYQVTLGLVSPALAPNYIPTLPPSLGKGTLSLPQIPCEAAAAKSIQLCPTLCDPIDGSPQAPPSLEFSRQEHWSGFPFPSPMHAGMLSHFNCVQLCDPMFSSPPGSSVHGIL